MTKRLLYIGNDLSKKSGYVTSMETLSKNFNEIGIEVVKYSNKTNQLFRLLHMCYGVVRHRNNVDYILIDTFSTLSFHFAVLTSQLARLCNVKYIPILHGGNLPSRIKSSVFLSNLIFRHSYRNVAPSNYLKVEYEALNYQAIYIPNILEIDKYRFQDRKMIRPRLLWVRAFKHYYNPLMAIETVDLLKSKYPDIKLCMVGPKRDDSYDLVIQEIQKRKLEDHIEITGLLTMKEWHKKSEEFDIFINTTNVDNTPVSVMEAMALGLAVISTDVGGIPYLIQNNKDGVLVQRDNAESMARAIENIISKPSIQLMLNARKKVESFAWKVVKQSWLNILK